MIIDNDKDSGPCETCRRNSKRIFWDAALLLFGCTVLSGCITAWRVAKNGPPREAEVMKKAVKKRPPFTDDNDNENARDLTLSEMERLKPLKPFRRYSPFTSLPPEPIPLYSTTKEYVKKRHECIVQIRQRREDLLGSYFRGSDDQLILMVDPAYQTNVGDHMMVLGQMEFVKRITANNNKTIIDQCGYFQSSGYIISCRDYLYTTNTYHQNFNTKIALWHGGGNWGDLWRPVQLTRVRSFSTLLQEGFTIVGMPQSYHYQNKSLELRDEQLVANQVAMGLRGIADDDEKKAGLDNRHSLVQSRVILTWRTAIGYEAAQKRYPYAKHLLVADIAFELGPYAPLPPVSQQSGNELRHDLLFLLRNDLESTLDQQRQRLDQGLLRNWINQAADKVGGRAATRPLSFRVVDWNSRHQLFTYETSPFFTNTSIQLLSLGRVLICDRLHASILAYLTGIPFVYIDQKTQKITKTLQVAFSACRNDTTTGGGEDTLWAKADNLTHAMATALRFLNKYDL